MIKSVCGPDVLSAASPLSNFTLRTSPSPGCHEQQYASALEWLRLASVQMSKTHKKGRAGKLAINLALWCLQTKHCALHSRWWDSARKSLSPRANFLAWMNATRMAIKWWKSQWTFSLSLLWGRLPFDDIGHRIVNQNYILVWLASDDHNYTIRMIWRNLTKDESYGLWPAFNSNVWFQGM